MEYPALKNVYTCYPGGKHKALTFSFDDGCVEDRRLVALFNQYGVKGTFNLNAGLRMESHLPQEEWAETYKGHEVACHTYLHPTIERSPLDQVVRQVLEDRLALEQLVGYPVRGLAYPNGSWTPEIAAVLPALGIRYARVVGDTHDFGIPHNFLTWKSTCHHTHNLLADGERFANLYKTQYLYLMYVWGHGFEFTCEEDWQMMEKFLKMVTAKTTPGTRPTLRSSITSTPPNACNTPPRQTPSTTPAPNRSGLRLTAGTSQCRAGSS